MFTGWKSAPQNTKVNIWDKSEAPRQTERRWIILPQYNVYKLEEAKMFYE